MEQDKLPYLYYNGRYEHTNEEKLGKVFVRTNTRNFHGSFEFFFSKHGEL